MMQLKTLKPAKGSRADRKRVARGIGSGFGKTAGRGHKGQKSRTGGSIRRGFEGGQMPLQRRVPKFGFTSAQSRYTDEVTLPELAKVGAEVITLAALKEADIVKGTVKRVRVILSGEIDKPVTVQGLGVTKGARAAIEAAGGTIKEADEPSDQESSKD